MYLIELALKLSPVPLSVQRKELDAAKSLYDSIKESLRKGENKLLELTCDQLTDKKFAVLLSEVLAVQMYEKPSSGGGSRRPGFSFDD